MLLCAVCVRHVTVCFCVLCYSEAAEYLASAGNRLSRRELRQTEESVATLQAEFWDIPLNFPDKCDIVGASTKNRYKSVL